MLRGSWNSPSGSPGHHLTSHSQIRAPRRSAAFFRSPSHCPHHQIETVIPQPLFRVPLCPKHSICLTVLGYPLTLSGPLSPIPHPPPGPPSQPQGIWDSPREILCPMPKHSPKGLEPYSAIFLFWPPPCRFLLRMWAPLPATAGGPRGHRCSCVPANCGSGVFMCTPTQQAHPR